MKTAYVATLYNGYNYGSVLQCFSLQHVIKKYGVEPYVLDVRHSGIRWKLRRILNNLRFYISCIKYPDRSKAFQGIVENAKNAGLGLSDVTREKINRFVTENINVRHCQYDSLKSIASDSECVACISGSDQVWSTSVKYLNPVHFLTFAPQSKRYSYAASFGSAVVPIWFRKDLKRYLSSYKYISVREESGINILNSLDINNGELMPDPTLLLTADEWTQVEKQPDLDTVDFEFIYFLNEPSPIAISHIESIKEKDGGETVYYSPFQRNEALKGRVKTISLDPDEFVWMIHHCKRIFTDSFHGVVFSILFHKEFYVYQREYIGVPDQSSRVLNILALTNLESQFITDAASTCVPNYLNVDQIVERERTKGYSCIKKILKAE